MNKFAADGDAKTFGEIYAYGFRNAHRLSWDPTDGTMFATDIGNSNIEEINIVREGGNYGWMRREGIFENGLHVTGGNGNQVYDLPADILDGTTRDGFTYPVAMYDHGEGLSITAGYAYYGRVAALRGKFIFGDIARGRLFAADVAALKAADDGIPRTVAPIQEIQLFVRDCEREQDRRLAAGPWGQADGKAGPCRPPDFAEPGRGAVRDNEARRHDSDARAGLEPRNALIFRLKPEAATKEAVWRTTCSRLRIRPTHGLPCFGTRRIVSRR